MSKPFNPFQTCSRFRFPPGAQKRLCKCLIISNLQSLSFLKKQKMVTFGHSFLPGRRTGRPINRNLSILYYGYHSLNISVHCFKI